MKSMIRRLRRATQRWSDNRDTVGAMEQARMRSVGGERLASDWVGGMKRIKMMTTLHNSGGSILENKEYIEKFQKYEADYKQYLMSKYFTDKTIFGGNIFDVKMNIDGQTITASRLPPYQSYLDPATFDELNNKGSIPLAETSTSSNSNGKPTI